MNSTRLAKAIDKRGLDLRENERPRFEVLKSDSASFAKWVDVRANRQDEFFVRPAGGADPIGRRPQAGPRARASARSRRNAGPLKQGPR